MIISIIIGILAAVLILNFLEEIIALAIIFIGCAFFVAFVFFLVALAQK